RSTLIPSTLSASMAHRHLPSFPTRRSSDLVVAKTEEEAVQEFEKQGKSAQGIRQEEDVLDTWFSSGLWPMSVFDGVRNPDNEDRSEEHTSELQSRENIVCRILLEKKNN